MLINVSEGEECRIALVEDGKLEELYMERTSSTSHVNNIYKGRVTNVEPSIQAAFVDFGLGRNGFLHISDLLPSYFGRNGEDVHEFIGKKMARRDRPPIQRCLRRGDEIVVQVIKEGIGTKGPTLSTYLSVSGRMLVMMPGVSGRGVSKKIEDEDERRRLKQILDALTPPDDCGFIIRTESVGKTKAEVERDLKYLARLWEQIKKKIASGPGPMELYTEGDLVSRTVRDVFTSDVEKIVVDNKDVARRVKDVIKITNPRTKNKVELYEDPVPLFHKYGIEKDIEMMYSRHVPLPSGGSLVIDSTEAIVAIDVNSGKFRDHSDAEMTAYKTDMEAADEIPRQLRLRDLGGVIICDFIDLRFERHRRDLERRLHDEFKKDRARTKVLRMSQFGIIEMTRQRMRPSLKRSIYFDCPHCKGAGLVKTPESMSLDVMRRLAIATHDARVVRVELSVCPDVSYYLQNRKRRQLAEMESRSQKQVVIRSDAALGLDEMRLDLFDNRDGLVIIEELGPGSALPHTTQLGSRPQPSSSQRGGSSARGRGVGRPDDRRKPAFPDRRPHQQKLPPPPPPREPEVADDRYDLDSVEADLDERERRMDDETDEGASMPPPAAAHSVREFDDADNDERSDDRAGQDDEPPMDDVRPAAAAAAGRGDRDSQTNVSGDEQGGGPRRRRRRGRRGRGRGRGGQDAQPPAGPPVEAGGHARPAEDEEPMFVGDDRDDRDVLDDRVADEEVRAESDEPMQPVEETRGEYDLEEVGDGPGPGNEAVDAPVRRGRPSPVGADPGGDSVPEEEGDAPRRRRRRRGGRGRRREGPGEENGEPATEAPPPIAHAGAPVRPPLPPRRVPPAPTPPPAPALVEPTRIQTVPRTGSTDRHLINDEPVLPEPIRRPRSYRDLDQIPDDLD